MITQSFIFLKGIRGATERNIWKQGINDWNLFLDAKKIRGISESNRQERSKQIKAAKEAFLNDNSKFFCCFPSSEQWRLYSHFRDEALFLDIETSHGNRELTVVGIFDGYATKTMVNGLNLDRKLLLSVFEKAKIVVTFNGKSFDIPILEKYFGFKLDIPHIDLKHVCQKLSLKGGLKEIEKKLGIMRPQHLIPLGGDHAVELWKAFKASGDREYLELLVDYNEEDCANLKRIADVCIPQLWSAIRNKAASTYER